MHGNVWCKCGGSRVYRGLWRVDGQRRLWAVQGHKCRRQHSECHFAQPALAPPTAPHLHTRASAKHARASTRALALAASSVPHA